MSTLSHKLPVAELFIGDDAFDEFNKYLNKLMQGEFTGEVMLVVRDGFNIVSRIVDPDDLVMGPPEGCELVVLDGGNPEGEAWKLVYHPAKRVSTFVRE